MTDSCTECTQHFEDARGAAPVLRDPIWQQLGMSKTDTLCGSCVLDLAWFHLGRALRLSDLLPCPFNVEPNHNMDRGWAAILADNPGEVRTFKSRVRHWARTSRTVT